MDILEISVDFGSADYYFCRRLIAKGYDSLQIFNSHSAKLNELVLDRKSVV
jgi:hypothetical protein